MDALFFRCLARELGEELPGKRLEKVFEPAPSAWAFVFGAAGFKKHLLFFPDRKNGALFLSSEKPDNPPEPTAEAMRLRKLFAGRFVLAAHADWPDRRLALEMSPRPDAPGHLVFDMVRGPAAAGELAGAFADDPRRPAWPEFERVAGDDEVWREYPHISPPLRAAVRRLCDRGGESRARALYDAARRGECAEYFITGSGFDARPYVWAPPGEAAERRESALEAARETMEPGFFARVTGGMAARAGTGDPARKARMKRARRALRRMGAEERQLRERLESGDKARALRSSLYKLDQRAKLHKVAVEGPEGKRIEVELDPSLDVVENMERFFRMAAKAERGLVALAARREGLERELADLESGRRDPPPQAQKHGTGKSSGSRKMGTGKKYAGGKGAGSGAGGDEKSRLLQSFRTSDGMMVLRGKNSGANHKLLSRWASSFDLWFHAADGPGAHVVLKRDHPGQEAPELSLEEAAILAGLKSWRAEDAFAEVMCALVRDVRKVKGLAAGQVMVDKVWRVLRVELDPELEERLRTL